MVLQGLEEDQQRVRSLLTEAITMLCRNSMSYQAELSVEGLLGITLDKHQVMLVNINQVVKHPSLQATDPLGGKHNDKPELQLHSDPLRIKSGYGESSIVSRPLTPMQPLHNTLRRGRGRRRALDSLRMRRAVNQTFPLEKSRNLHHTTGSSVANNRPRRTSHTITSAATGYEPMEQAATDSASPTTTPPNEKDYSSQFPVKIDIEIKEEPVDADDASGSGGRDQQTVLAPDGTEQIVHKLEMLEHSNSGVVVMEQQAEAELSLGGTEVVEAASSTNADNSNCQDWDPTTLRGNTPMGHDDSWQEAVPSGDHNTKKGALGDHNDLSLSNLDPAFVQRVCLSILKEDGCFVTSRMLCRRYSALFKVHGVVLAMKKMTMSHDHPHHLGMYRLISERTKVFYKCPPHLVKASALEQYGIQLQDYHDMYYRLPRSKNMNSPNFVSFVENILRENPYGAVPLQQLVWDEPQAVVAAIAEPATIYDEWELQSAIMNGDGCFISSRILQRRISKKVKTTNIMCAMQAMTRPEQSPHHVGHFVKISERIKIFYKCPPDKVSSEALAMYQLTPDKYRQLFYCSPIQSGRGVKNWQNYTMSVAQNSPYGLDSFPFESLGLPPGTRQQMMEAGLNTKTRHKDRTNTQTTPPEYLDHSLDSSHSELDILDQTVHSNSDSIHDLNPDADPTAHSDTELHVGSPASTVSHTHEHDEAVQGNAEGTPRHRP